MSNHSFLFLSANTPWVYALAEAMAGQHPVHAVRFYDWLNYRRLKPAWPNGRCAPPLLQRTMKVMAPGYAGQLEAVFRQYIQDLIGRWCRQLKAASGTEPWVVAPYPYLNRWLRKVPGERLIYYNLDDYTLYQPSRAEEILEQEDELVDRAALTVCLSASQAASLRVRHPRKAMAIHHFPLGVVDSFINVTGEKPSEPLTVGYVGNLIDRIDWALVLEVALRLPDIPFMFVGSLDASSEGKNTYRPAWKKEREAVLSLLNVRHVAQVAQEEVARYYWSFAVSWVPYSVEHPFNIASCPTKIMDGLASGRPVLSSGLPEAYLYPEWITVYNSAEEASHQLRNLIVQAGNPEGQNKARRQLEFSQLHTWERRVRTLEAWLR